MLKYLIPRLGAPDFAGNVEKCQPTPRGLSNKIKDEILQTEIKHDFNPVKCLSN